MSNLKYGLSLALVVMLTGSAAIIGCGDSDDDAVTNNNNQNNNNQNNNTQNNNQNNNAAPDYIDAEIEWNYNPFEETTDRAWYNSAPALSPDERLLYVLSGRQLSANSPCEDCRLYAIDTDTGQKEWTYDTADNDLGLAVGDDGTIYGTTRSEIFAVDSEGEEVWNQEISPETSPSLLGDDTILVGASDSLYGLDVANGESLWDVEIGEAIFAELFVDEDGHIYFSTDNALMSVTTEGEPEIRWEFDEAEVQFQAGFIPQPPVISPDGMMYAIAGGDTLHAVDTDNGEPQWKINEEEEEALGRVFQSNKLVVDDSGHVYFSGYTEEPLPFLIRADSSGAVEPLYSFADVLSPWEIVVTQAGEVVMAKQRGVTLASDKNGNDLWDPDQFRLDADSMVMDQQGTIYLMTGKEIYAVSTELAAPMTDGWPMRGQNPQRTGSLQ